MSERATAELSVERDGKRSAWAVRLTGPGGQTLFQASAVTLPSEDALYVATQALIAEAKRRRLHPRLLVSDRLRKDAESLLPQDPALSVRIESVSPFEAKAHSESGHTYRLDLKRRTCSCPDFAYRHHLCKHLRAALGL